MTTDIKPLADIVQVSRDSAEFYDHARQAVENPAIRQLFTRMANSKRRLVDVISSRIRMEGEEPPEQGTLIGSLRQFYADARSLVASNDEAVYVAQLEETEDRVLEHLGQAIKQIDDPTLRSSVMAVLPEARATHEEMRELKQRLAA